MCEFNIEEDDEIWDKLKAVRFKRFEDDVMRWQEECYQTDRIDRNYSDDNMMKNDGRSPL